MFDFGGTFPSKMKGSCLVTNDIIIIYAVLFVKREMCDSMNIEEISVPEFGARGPSLSLGVFGGTFFRVLGRAVLKVS